MARISDLLSPDHSRGAACGERPARLLLAPSGGLVAGVVGALAVEHGIVVEEAADGDEVLRQAATAQVDLVVLSTELDDALELCGELRANPGLRYAGLLVVSPERAPPSLVAAGLLSGADDFASAAPSHAPELAARLRVQLRNVRYRDTLGRMRAERNLLRGHATTDPLTSLPNRRAFEAALHEALAGERPVSALFVDVDHFKVVNDLHGHAVGDQVLREVAAALARSTRSGDTCARYGGEEFVLLLVGADLEVAVRVAERHRAAVERIPAEKLGGPEQVTVSVGVAARAAGAGEDATDLLARADEALYRAKRGGRNRVEVGGASDETPSAVRLPMAPLAPLFSLLPGGSVA